MQKHGMKWIFEGLSCGSNTVDQGRLDPDFELVPIGAPTEHIFTNALLWATFSMLNKSG